MKTLFLLFLIFTLIGCSEYVEPNLNTTKPGEFTGYQLGFLPNEGGVSKIKIDSIYYIVLKSADGGVAIIKHQ